MVNALAKRSGRSLSAVIALIVVYVAIVVATIVVLIALSLIAPAAATPEAWGHGIVVGVFALLLPLRLRSARRGSGRGYAAIGIIAAVLAVVNLVEGTLAGVFPLWMRIEMFAIAALMVTIVVLIMRNQK